MDKRRETCTVSEARKLNFVRVLLDLVTDQYLDHLDVLYLLLAWIGLLARFQPRWCRGAGLLVVRCLVLLLLIGIPNSLHASKREAPSSQRNGTTLLLLLLLLLTAAITTATFLRLQASDPGYLDEGAWRRRSRKLRCKAEDDLSNSYALASVTCYQSQTSSAVHSSSMRT